MTACERCGHFNPYWRADRDDTDREYAMYENVREWLGIERVLTVGEVYYVGGFAVQFDGKYVRRMPWVVYQARGSFDTPYDRRLYYDSVRWSGRSVLLKDGGG